MHDHLVLVIVAIAAMMQILILADSALVIITYSKPAQAGILVDSFGGLISPLIILASILQLCGLLAYYWLTAFKYNKFCRDVISGGGSHSTQRKLETMYTDWAMPVLTVVTSIPFILTNALPAMDNVFPYFRLLFTILFSLLTVPVVIRWDKVILTKVLQHYNRKDGNIYDDDVYGNDNVIKTPHHSRQVQLANERQERTRRVKRRIKWIQNSNSIFGIALLVCNILSECVFRQQMNVIYKIQLALTGFCHFFNSQYSMILFEGLNEIKEIHQKNLTSLMKGGGNKSSGFSPSEIQSSSHVMDMSSAAGGGIKSTMCDQTLSNLNATIGASISRNQRFYTRSGP